MKINFNKTLTILLAVGLFFGSSSSALAVALQPPGQMPITEPLRPIDPGVEPNYSNNVQDDSKTPANVVTDKPEDEPEAVNTNSANGDSNSVAANSEDTINSSVEKSNKKWIILLVLVIIAAIGGGIYWRRKLNRTEASFIIAGLLLSSFTILGLGGLGLTYAQAQAQTQSSDKPAVIQRTIVEENDQGLTPSQVTAQSSAQDKSKKTVTFGLVAIILIIIAIGGAVMLWKENLAKSTTPNPVPTPDLDLKIEDKTE